MRTNSPRLPASIGLSARNSTALGGYPYAISSVRIFRISFRFELEGDVRGFSFIYLVSCN